MVHVQQNEEAKKIFNKDIKTVKDFEEYKLMMESLAKEKVNDLLNKGYTYDVSRYAADSYDEKTYTEVMAELYTFLSLGGKKP